jgi:transcriptional regulator with XRE-family HTH domain
VVAPFFCLEGLTMNKLKVARTMKDVRQAKLALLTGIHQTKLSLIENKLAIPNEDEKRHIAEALGVKAEWLWSEDSQDLPSGEIVHEP